jgi:hypothetical protein
MIYGQMTLNKNGNNDDDDDDDDDDDVLSASQGKI